MAHVQLTIEKRLLKIAADSSGEELMRKLLYTLSRSKYGLLILKNKDVNTKTGIIHSLEFHICEPPESIINQMARVERELERDVPARP